MKSEDLRAGLGIRSVTVARDPTAGKGLRLDDNGRIPASLLNLTTYRKTSSKTVNTSTTETDLLNSEITIAANAIGPNGLVRIVAAGDWKQNSGAASGPPRLKLKLASTTLVDTGAGNATGIGNSASRFPWRVDALIQNLGATNAQWVTFRSVFGLVRTATTSFNAPTTGEGEFYSLSDGGATEEYVANLGNSATVDTTAAVALVLSTINASANAAYEVVLKHALVEII